VTTRSETQPTGLRARAETRVGVGVLVAALIAGAFVARVLLARYVVAPWLIPDEVRYAVVARSFLSTGHYLFRDHSDAVPSIYPALISPAWLASSAHTAFTLIKTINSALMVAAAIPLYFWARRLVTPLWAVVAVVLYLAMPGFVYTGSILTENVYVPAVVLGLFASAVAIERPTLQNQLLALAALVLAVVARIQGVVLFVVLPTAIGVALVFDAVAAAPGDRRRVVAARARRFWPSFGALVLGFVAYVVYESARGMSLAHGFGVYSDVAQVHYSFVSVLRWTVYHFGELAFAVALLPLSALIVLFGLACRRTTAPAPAERAFVAVAAAALVWIVLEAAAFASHWSLRVEERYMLSVFPVLFLALVVWLARGLPRPVGLTAAAVLVPIALLLAVPFESLISSPGSVGDTFGLIPLNRLSNVLAGGVGDARILVAAGALLAGILFASLPRSWARIAAPVAVFGFLVLASGSVFAEITFLSRATRQAGGLTGDPSWIDRAVGKDKRVEFLYTPDIDADQHILYQAEFWNRSVRRIFGVTAPVPSIGDVTAPLDPKTGRIRPDLPAGSPDVNPRYVVAAQNVDVAGKRLATGGLLALSRVRPPLRLASLTSGITPDGWTSPSASYTHFVGAKPGSHVVVAVSRPQLNGPPPARVTVSLSPLGAPNRVWAKRSWVVGNGTTHHFDLPLHRGPFQVQLDASPSFVPSSFGLPDTRTLGVQATFSLR
jgi:hypothetical protein